MIRKFFLFSISSLLRIYKYSLSTILPSSCRFYPTCSEYAVDAMKKYGFLRGMLYALIRVAKCHPMGNGGYDPIN